MVISNEQRIRIANEELLANGNLDVVGETFAAGYVVHAGGKEHHGLDFVRRFVKQLRAAIADLRVLEIAILSKRGNIKRVPGLTGDLDRHLRRIQHAAFPDAVPAIPLRLLEGMTGQELQTPVPIVPGIAPPPPSNEPQRLRQGQARPQPLSPRVQFVMQALRNRLTLGFAQQEQALRLSISEASDRDKRTLRYTLRVLQEHRNTIMVAFTEEQAPR